MRSVTAYPPAALPAPSSTAKKPIICCCKVSALSKANNPPTTTMPCTKLEPDMSGVCKMAGTRPITTQPVKPASMNIYKATKLLMPISKVMRFSWSGLAGLDCRLRLVAWLDCSKCGAVLENAVVREHRFRQYVIAPIDGDDVVLHQQCQQVVLVLGIQIAGVAAQQGRDVERCDDGDLPNPCRLAGHRILAVAATVRRQVDNHGSRFHSLHLCLADQFWRRLAGNGGGGDDEISLLYMPGQYRIDLFFLFSA